MNDSTELNAGSRGEWTTLPEDVLSRICSILEPKDLAMMKVSCKEWKDCTPKLYLAENPLWFGITMDRLLFSSLPQGYTFSVKHEMCTQMIKYCSYADSLITTVGKDNLIRVLNVLTCSVTELPSLKGERIVQAISWKCPCNIFGTFAISRGGNEVQISLYCKTMGWMRRTYDCRRPFLLSEDSAPVISEGHIYCLGTNCEVGIFDPDSLEWNVQSVKLFWPLYVHEKGYLLSTQTDIMAVILDQKNMSLPRVLKLDMQKKMWNRMWSLDKNTIFSGCPTSVLVRNNNRLMEAKVFFMSANRKYDLIEAQVKFHDGKLIFVVENHNIPFGRPIARLQLNWWLVDGNNIVTTKPGVPCRKRKRDSDTHGDDLPVGTMMVLEVVHEEENLPVAGPCERPKLE